MSEESRGKEQLQRGSWDRNTEKRRETNNKGKESLKKAEIRRWGTGIKSCIKRNCLKSPLDYSMQFLQSNSEDSEYFC